MIIGRSSNLWSQFRSNDVWSLLADNDKSKIVGPLLYKMESNLHSHLKMKTFSYTTCKEHPFALPQSKMACWFPFGNVSKVNIAMPLLHMLLPYACATRKLLAHFCANKPSKRMVCLYRDTRSCAAVHAWAHVNLADLCATLVPPRSATSPGGPQCLFSKYISFSRCVKYM